jgi:hypothetical protein
VVYKFFRQDNSCQMTLLVYYLWISSRFATLHYHIPFAPAKPGCLLWILNVRDFDYPDKIFQNPPIIILYTQSWQKMHTNFNREVHLFFNRISCHFLSFFAVCLILALILTSVKRNHYFVWQNMKKKSLNFSS